jgi:hypothetical protein
MTMFNHDQTKLELDKKKTCERKHEIRAGKQQPHNSTSGTTITV